MFDAIRNLFNKEVSRYHSYDFDLSFFRNESDRIFFRENGYVVVKDIVSDDSIQTIKKAYNLLIKHKDFYPVDGFITSANYGLDIQSKIHNILLSVNQDILPKIYDVKTIHHSLLNFLVLKFCKDKEKFFPHQDAPFVEEDKGASVLSWIPTEDMNEKNGSLLVLPKSHKYFRWQHTHNQQQSPLSKLHSEILKKMTPVYLKKGDLILFDNALIHASMPNLTNNVRIAANTGVASKKYDLVHYRNLPNKSKKIEKFIIDEDFWLSGNYMTPDIVPEKYGNPVVENIKRTKKYSLREFNKIMSN